MRSKVKKQKKMANKFFLAILSFLVVIPLLASCTGNKSEVSETNSGEVSDGQSQAQESSTETPSEKNYPHLIGTFMQPGAFAGYTSAQMNKHFDYLKEVGIENLILQWSFTNTSGGVCDVYFDSSFADKDKSSTFSQSGKNLVKNLLDAAKSHGMKIYMGLNNNDEWWSKYVTDKAWLDEQTRLGIEGAKQIYELYKDEYSNELAGWYFVFEYFNFKDYEPYIENAAYLLSSFRDGLAAIDEKMPMMLSPFVSSAQSDAASAKDMWTRIFAKTSFREGDIYCCQDSVGAGHIKIDEMEAYFAALKEAVDTKPGLRFWANNEDFTLGVGTAPFDRFLRQLQISEKYCEEHVTFAYSHYQIPDMGKTGHHNAYKYYYENGKIPEQTSLTAPEFTVKADSLGLNADISCTADNSSSMLFSAVITKDGKEVKQLFFENNYSSKSVSISYKDSIADANGKLVYGMYFVDYFGNKTKTTEQTVEVSAASLKVVSTGKSYTHVNNSTNYPDETGKSLTDNKSGAAAYSDTAWMGFVGNATITVDLGQITNKLTAFRVQSLYDNVAGVLIPTNVKISVSDDGKTFKQVGAETYPAFTSTTSAIESRVVTLKEPVDGRYVKFEITGQSWVFIDEVSVFAMN